MRRVLTRKKFPQSIEYWQEIREMVRRKANGLKRKMDEDRENKDAGRKCRYYRCPSAWENVIAKRKKWEDLLKLIDAYIDALEEEEAQKEKKGE